MPLPPPLSRDDKVACRLPYRLDLSLAADAVSRLGHNVQQRLVSGCTGKIGNVTFAVTEALKHEPCEPRDSPFADVLTRCHGAIGVVGSMVLRFEDLHTMADAKALAKAMQKPNSAAVRLVLALLDDQLRQKVVDDPQQLAVMKTRASVGGPLGTHVLLSKPVPAGHNPRPTRPAVIVPPHIEDAVITTVVNLGRHTVGSTVGKQLALAVVYLRDHILDGCSSSMIVWFVDHKTACDFSSVFHREHGDNRDDAERRTTAKWWATTLLTQWEQEEDAASLSAIGLKVVASSDTDKFIVFVSWDEKLHHHGREALLDILSKRAKIDLRPFVVADKIFMDLDTDFMS